jgi:hypothetical protein
MSKDLSHCRLCTRRVEDPYRRYVDDKTVEGCVGKDHDGHLYGTSLQWHMRPVAKRIRKSLAAMISKP